jgi:hypothetical protein
MRLPFLAFGAASVLAAQIVISQTGSTNTPAVNITIGAKGRAVVANEAGERSKMTVEPALHAKLLKDLEAAAPISQLKTGHCMKSASFGTRLYVKYKGEKSPDLSCPSADDPQAVELARDLKQIMEHAQVKGLPGRRMHPM